MYVTGCARCLRQNRGVADRYPLCLIGNGSVEPSALLPIPATVTIEEGIEWTIFGPFPFSVTSALCTGFPLSSEVLAEGKIPCLSENHHGIYLEFINIYFTMARDTVWTSANWKQRKLGGTYINRSATTTLHNDKVPEDYSPFKVFAVPRAVSKSAMLSTRCLTSAYDPRYSMEGQSCMIL